MENKDPLAGMGWILIFVIVGFISATSYLSREAVKEVNAAHVSIKLVVNGNTWIDFNSVGGR